MKLLLRLGTKEFLSGVSTLGAHADRGGLFYKATGVTPLFDAGTDQSINNGLLMAGAAGTAATYGSVTGDIMRLIPDGGVYYSGGLGLIGVTNDNEIIKVALSAGVPSGALAVERTVSGHTLTPGVVVFGINGAQTLLYRQVDQIGKYVSSTYTDAYQAATTDYFGAMHVHYGLNKVIFGNGPGKLGTLNSTGTFTLAALAFDTNSYCTALSDDGVYVISAITRNASADTTLFNETQIIFWDGSATTGFIRNYPIADPHIYSIQNTPTGVYAFGKTGIWQVSFDGVKKIYNHNPGVYTVTSSSAIHYGKGATSFFSDALIWGGQVASGTERALSSLGKLDSSSLNSYLQPLNLTASKNITAVSGQLSKGYVFVADDTPQLLYYPIGSGTPQTSISAQTVYFQLPGKYEISYIDVVFGEPLVSGDAVSIQLKQDEDTAVVPTTALTASFANDGATRRKRVKITNYIAEAQLSLVINFVTGAVKIKRIDIYGSPMANAAD